MIYKYIIIHLYTSPAASVSVTVCVAAVSLPLLVRPVSDVSPRVHAVTDWVPHAAGAGYSCRLRHRDSGTFSWLPTILEDRMKFSQRPIFLVDIPELV